MFKRKNKEKELIIYNSIELYYSTILEGEDLYKQRTNDIIRMVCTQLEERGLNEPFDDEWVQMDEDSTYDYLSLTTVKSRNDGDVSIWVKLTPMDQHMKEMCRINLDSLEITTNEKQVQGSFQER